MASRIYQLVQLIELRHTSFAVSRLIMLSGVKVRKYTQDSVDDPQDLARVERAARTLLSEPEHASLDAVLRSR